MKVLKTLSNKPIQSLILYNIDDDFSGTEDDGAMWAITINHVEMRDQQSKITGGQILE